MHQSSDSFPIIQGKKKDEEAAEDFSVNKFLSLNDDPSRKGHVFCTDATDLDDPGPIMRKVMRIAAERPGGEWQSKRTK